MKKKEYPTETLEVEITSLDDQGYGRATYYHPPKEGHPERKKLKLKIPQTYPGDVVRVTVPNARGRKRALVPYDEILTWSPSRMGVPREDQSMEAGAPLSLMRYEDQLAYKENEVKSSLQDENFSMEAVQPVLGMEDPYHYRNKMELSFGSDGTLGMHQQGNYRKVVDWKTTVLAPETMMSVKNIVSQWQKDWSLSGYDKDSHQGLLRSLVMRESRATGELMVVLFATASARDYAEASKDLKGRLVDAFPQLASFMWMKDTDIADRSEAEETTVLYGRDYIHDELSGFHYRLWYNTFFQPNPLQAEKMIETALDFADVNKGMKVLDLFCGVGTFSLPFASRAKALAGIEIVPQSIASAKQNAKENGIDNTYFLARDARKGMTEVEESWGKPDLILLDPPRSGAGGKVMRHIGRMGTEKVIYISCNPRSFAKDITWLRDYGYQLQVVQPIDQFPHTVHVECVSLLEK